MTSRNHSTIYINNDKDIEYVKKHKLDLFNNIIIGPSNMVDKITDNRELYLILIAQQNRFAINNYKEEDVK